MEDHLITARRCLQLQGVEWRPRLATEAFVRKLISKGLLEPAHGEGAERRMSPSGYHALLKIIQWKSRGISSWHAWRVGLWLRGTYFPLPEVRASLAFLLTRLKRIVLKDIAPTGRWTERFHEKYEKYQRRLKRIEDGLIAPEFAGFMEPLMALFLGKKVEETEPNLKTSLAQIYDGLPSDMPLSSQEALLISDSLLARMKQGGQLTLPEQQNLFDTICRLVGPLVGPQNAPGFVASVMGDLGTMLFTQTGDGLKFNYTLDDLIAGVTSANDHELRRVRTIAENIVCGRVTRASRDLPPEARALPMVQFMAHAQPGMLRAAARQSPLFGSIIVANVVRGLRVLGDPKAIR